METIVNMQLVGFYHFSSKDKTQHYYVLQALSNDERREEGINRGSLCSVFVTSEIYEQIMKLKLGTPLKIGVKANIDTGKITFRLVDYSIDK